jgi:hypothetical protein
MTKGRQVRFAAAAAVWRPRSCACDENEAFTVCTHVNFFWCATDSVTGGYVVNRFFRGYQSQKPLVIRYRTHKGFCTTNADGDVTSHESRVTSHDSGRVTTTTHESSHHHSIECACVCCSTTSTSWLQLAAPSLFTHCVFIRNACVNRSERCGARRPATHEPMHVAVCRH